MPDTQDRKILFLSHTLPFPLISGERIRNYHLLRQLSKRGWQITLFSMSNVMPSSSEAARLASLCESVHIEVMSSSSFASRGRLVRNLVTRKAFHESFFHNRAANKAFQAVLAKNRNSLLYVSQLYMYPYARETFPAPFIFDSVNAEELRMRTLGRRHGLRSLIARGQEAAIRRLEHEAAASSSRVFAVSPEERDHFETIAPGRVDLIPNGVDTETIMPREMAAAPTQTILFLGSLNYSANLDALHHLINDIIPLLRNRNAELVVVGSQPDRRAQKVCRGSSFPIRLIGQVPDVTPYLNRARLLAVPLREGAGTRLKILESLAYGVPVVSTALGCEGLGLRNELEIVIADDPVAFACAIDRILDDDSLCSRLAERGRSTVEERFGWTEIGSAAHRILCGVAHNTGFAGAASASS